MRAGLAFTWVVVVGLFIVGCDDPGSTAPEATAPGTGGAEAATNVEYGSSSVRLKTGTVRELFSGQMKIDNVSVKDGRVDLVATYFPGKEPDGTRMKLFFEHPGIGGDEKIDLMSFPMSFTADPANAQLAFEFSDYDPGSGVMMDVSVTKP